MASSKRKPKPVSESDIKKFIQEIKDETYTSSSRKTMSWELLVTIKNFLLSSPSYTHAREALGIYKNTWYRWKDQGEEILRSMEEEEIDVSQLSEYEQQLIAFVYYLRITKAKMIKRHWNNMETLAETDYRAGQFVLKVLDPETFNIEAKMKLSGAVGNISAEEEQDRIREMLSDFLPKDSIEDLEEGE